LTPANLLKIKKNIDSHCAVNALCCLFQENFCGLESEFPPGWEWKQTGAKGFLGNPGDPVFSGPPACLKTKKGTLSKECPSE
jgi:hypothetical protein